MGLTPQRILTGFLAGALSVLVFHQGMILLLGTLNVIPASPWSFRPIPPLGVPALLNSMFWGGLWGIGFVAVVDRMLRGDYRLRGVLYGLIGPFLLGNGLLVPLIRGGPLLWGGQPMRMLIGALIASAFGLGLALFVPFVTRFTRRV